MARELASHLRLKHAEKALLNVKGKVARELASHLRLKQRHDARTGHQRNRGEGTGFASAIETTAYNGAITMQEAWRGNWLRICD